MRRPLPGRMSPLQEKNILLLQIFSYKALAQCFFHYLRISYIHAFTTLTCVYSYDEVDVHLLLVTWARLGVQWALHAKLIMWILQYKARIAEFCNVLSHYCPPPWESEAPISKIRRQNMQQNMHEMHWEWTTGFGNESDPIQETSNRPLANKVFVQVHGSAWACSIPSHCNQFL